MNKSIKFAALFLSAALAFTAFCACFEKPKPKTDSEKLIYEMINDYGYHQDEANPRIEELLSQLEENDPETGKNWRDIMAYWRYTTNELTVNYGALPDGLSDSDSLCLVVLGFQLNPDGSIKDELVGRLTTALACAKQYPNAYVLCTGGGTASKNKSVTEAGQMAAWLRENGLDESRIILEDKSRTTGQNAMFSEKLLREKYPEVTDVAIISSDYHISWGSVLFGAQFILTNDGSREISVVSNAAFKPESHAEYGFHYQAAGLLEIANLSDDAFDIYQGKATAPKLD